jgi:hypothetical protein
LAVAYLKSMLKNGLGLGTFIYTDYFTINLYDLMKYESYYSELSSKRISYIDPQGCLNAITSSYQTGDSSVIPTLKIDWYNKVNYMSSDESTQRLAEVTIQLLDPLKYEAIDESKLQSICKNQNLNYHVYSPETTQQVSESYDNFKALGVDIYSPTDTFFTSKCYIYKNSTNEMDVPLVTRKTDIFLGTSYICGSGCTFNGTSKDSYVICNCEASYKSKIYIEQKSFDDYTLTNMDIINCTYEIVISSNIGFIILIIILILSVLSVIFAFFMFNRYLRKYFRDILYSDCNTLITKHTLDGQSKKL